MSDDGKSGAATALTAAISMLGLSLGISAPAAAQWVPGVRGAQPSGPQPMPGAQPGTEGILIGLDQPASRQVKIERSEQLKSEQFKSEQLKSRQFKSQQFKSEQVKLQGSQLKQVPQQ